MYVRNALSNTAVSLDVSACDQHANVLNMASAATEQRTHVEIRPGMLPRENPGQQTAVAQMTDAEAASLPAAHLIVGRALVRDGGTDEWAPVQRQSREVVLREVDCTHAQNSESGSAKSLCLGMQLHLSEQVTLFVA